MSLEPGLVGVAELVVADADTAVNLGSGDVPVLGTPRLAALVEEAACEAVAGRLGPDDTTVGTEVQLKHLLPVAVGKKVRAEATLDRIEGRRLTFTVSVTNETGLVAAGKITRAVVDRDKFLDKSR